jgi:peptidase E
MNQEGRRRLDFAPLVHHAVDLATRHSQSAPGGRAKVCHLGTAGGDQRWFAAELDEAGRAAGFDLSHLHLFPMPSIAAVEDHLMAQDAIWVGGGSVANLLAVWRLHGLDEIFRRVWQAGVVLGGVSAGSICWHSSGTTDSFGPDLRPIRNGLALLPYGNGVHYDSESRRRPLIHQLVADGVLPTTYCTDDGVGLVYSGTTLVEAVTESAGQGAYLVQRSADGSAEETRIEPRAL